jgi:hypothetical protein
VGGRCPALNARHAARLPKGTSRVFWALRRNPNLASRKGEHPHNPLGVFLPLEDEQRIVGIAHQFHIAPAVGLDRGGHPLVQDLVQEHVRDDRRGIRALQAA